MRKVEFLGKMPDPFLKEDGTRMTKEEWLERKDEIRQKIVDFEYGGMPPRPEFVEFEEMNNEPVPGRCAQWYKIKAGKPDKYVTFNLQIITNDKGKDKYSVLLTGDDCFENLESDTVKEAYDRGYVTARFNRLDLAYDTKERRGPLYEVYPECPDFTAISAWAWGYSVCMDVFEKLDYVDETEVGITGHSRGGKTVLLAGAVDERIKYVCPNNSGCHGAVSHRCYVVGLGWHGDTERIGTMVEMFPSWMGPKLWDYVGKENELPYDMHYFGALIAPRYYLQCEGMQDYWINPIGAWQNFAAVKECYKYLGCEDNAGAWFRPGFHRHKLPDFTQFLDFMDRARAGEDLAEHLKVNPYPEIEKNFDWE
ncbi:MAG: hypothetical protein E7395_00095 [Ruminococcaceae bacterium]|nr:hypothetical protein [Oscillospiraceae bacterium]